MQPHAVRAGYPPSAVLIAATCSSQVLQEFRVALVLERHGALHREIGRVDLQDQAGLMDGEVFGPHLARERHQVGLVQVVMGIIMVVATMPGEGAVMNISANGVACAWRSA